ncbi:MAG: class I adenylate-forming enzyme family protein [Lachnospiraceae bacterium]|nr:class I adenylate-forming enzyme family protein [Lachnospiraceae bacterium]MDD3617008.1 class I adenylate-forming enzyme family protein [Lachnospiraceae bacterium]
MYKGSKLWKNKISFELTEKVLSNGRVIETFPNLPDNLYEALKNSAGKYPDKMAVVDDLGRSFTYTKLLQEVDKFAACLKYRFGVQKGDHIALMVYSSGEFCTAFLAMVKLGAIAVMIPTKYKEQEVCSLADKSDLQGIICDKSFEPWFQKYQEKGRMLIALKLNEAQFALHTYENEEYPIEASEGGYEDISVMMFTSGTTSQSKGVMLTNFNFMHAAAVYKACFHVTHRDSTVIPVPTYMITGLSALFGLFIYSGGTIYMQRIFKAEQVLKCIRDHKVTFMHAAPTVYTILLEARDDFPKLPSLRCLACGGSGMPKEKIEKIHTWLPECEFHTVYGMTETTSPGTILPESAIESSHLGSNGIPVPGLCFKVVDEEGRELSAGQSGEIMVSGANILDCYYKLDTQLYQDWWLDTGDVGYFTEEGYCYILDRKKDMINRGGEKITSIDVESQLYKIEGIADAAVVGIPHEIYGETPVAMVKLEKDIKWSEEGIQNYLKNKIAKYKIPSKIVFVDAIPLTPNGKVDKKKIRTMFNNE